MLRLPKIETRHSWAPVTESMLDYLYVPRSSMYVMRSLLGAECFGGLPSVGPLHRWIPRAEDIKSSNGQLYQYFNLRFTAYFLLENSGEKIVRRI